MIASDTSAYGPELAHKLRTQSGADSPRYRSITYVPNVSGALDMEPMLTSDRLPNFKGTDAVTQGSERTSYQVLVENVGRGQRLYHFIERAKASGEITPKIGNLAWQAWKIIRQSVPGILTVLDASYGPSGQFLFVWDKDEHHLELEIDADGSGYFFSRNRTSGAFWGSDYVICDELQSNVVEALEIFA